MNYRNRLFGTVPVFLIDMIDSARTLLGTRIKSAVALAPAAAPRMNGILELRPSQILPGQMIVPLAWPVSELHSRSPQEESKALASWARRQRQQGITS